MYRERPLLQYRHIRNKDLMGNEDTEKNSLASKDLPYVDQRRGKNQTSTQESENIVDVRR